MAHTEERKLKISQGVTERYLKEGRSTGAWIRVEKVCPTCGISYKAPNRQKYCSVACRPKRTADEKKASGVHAVVKRRKTLKDDAIAYKGGKCEFCGYCKCVEALEFHHVDPKSKDFSISGKSKSWQNIKEELDKCVMLCANCHRELHAVVYKYSK